MDRAGAAAKAAGGGAAAETSGAAAEGTSGGFILIPTRAANATEAAHPKPVSGLYQAGSGLATGLGKGSAAIAWWMRAAKVRSSASGKCPCSALLIR